MFVAEYGADAFEARHSVVDEAAHARATDELTRLLFRASSMQPGGVVLGTIFELADEWWKDMSGDDRAHDTGGVVPGGGPWPEETFNEDFWGLLQYDGTPRQAFWTYVHARAPGAGEAQV